MNLSYHTEATLNVICERSDLKLSDYWESRPGPGDDAVRKKYLKPYLSEKESEILFLHLSCGLKFNDIAKRMHTKTPTLRMLWKRAKAKTLEAEQKTVSG